VLIAMALGAVTGAALNRAVAPAQLTEIIGYFSLATDVFLRLVKMIIAPLVFSTLIVGIAHMGGGGALGRVGARTIGWFLAASIGSLLLGLALVHLLRPGVGLNLPLPAANAQVSVAGGALNLKDFVTHLVPKSIVEAMANNEILQIVVFSGFFGVAL